MIVNDGRMDEPGLVQDHLGVNGGETPLDRLSFRFALGRLEVVPNPDAPPYLGPEAAKELLVRRIAAFRHRTNANRGLSKALKHRMRSGAFNLS